MRMAAISQDLAYVNFGFIRNGQDQTDSRQFGVTESMLGCAAPEWVANFKLAATRPS